MSVRACGRMKVKLWRFSRSCWGRRILCASKWVVRRDHSSRIAVTLFWGDMFREDFLVAFLCCSFMATGRSKESREGRHVVVGPLWLDLGEERAVIAVCAVDVWLAWDFDATKGYPGEDGKLLWWQNLWTALSLWGVFSAHVRCCDLRLLRHAKDHKYALLLIYLPKLIDKMLTLSTFISHYSFFVIPNANHILPTIVCLLTLYTNLTFEFDCHSLP